MRIHTCFFFSYSFLFDLVVCVCVSTASCVCFYGRELQLKLAGVRVDDQVGCACSSSSADCSNAQKAQTRKDSLVLALLLACSSGAPKEGQPSEIHACDEGDETLRVEATSLHQVWYPCACDEQGIDTRLRLRALRLCVCNICTYVWTSSVHRDYRTCQHRSGTEDNELAIDVLLVYNGFGGLDNHTPRQTPLHHVHL